MTEKEALIWVLGILGSVCAAAITLDKVLDIIHKYVKKAKEPDDVQNRRIEELTKRVGALEAGYANHSEALARDLKHFLALENAITILLKSNRAVLGAQLSGDNVDAMKQSYEEIDNFLYERRESSWKQSKES